MNRWSGRVVLADAVMAAWGLLFKNLHFRLHLHLNLHLHFYFMDFFLRGLRKECFSCSVLHLGPVWVDSILVSYECNDDIRLSSTFISIIISIIYYYMQVTIYT